MDESIVVDGWLDFKPVGVKNDNYKYENIASDQEIRDAIKLAVEKTLLFSCGCVVLLVLFFVTVAIVSSCRT